MLRLRGGTEQARHVIAETEFTSLNWSPSKWDERSLCRVMHPSAVKGHSRMQPKQQTVASSSFRIFVAGSLAVNPAALTFRSERRGQAVLPPLCT